MRSQPSRQAIGKQAQQATQVRQLKRMDEWYRSALGHALFEAEQARLARLCMDWQAQRLLQIGGPSCFQFGGPQPFKHFRVSPELSSGFRGCSVSADMCELPIASASMDVVFLPHTLEMVAHPAQILQEAYRILQAEGTLIILGFNPWSVWLLSQRWGRCSPLPWDCRWDSARCLRLALATAGFTLFVVDSVFFRPAVQNVRWLRATRILEGIGHLCWPNNGAVHVIIAGKRELGVTPLQRLRYNASRILSTPQACPGLRSRT